MNIKTKKTTKGLVRIAIIDKVYFLILKGFPINSSDNIKLIQFEFDSLI